MKDSTDITITHAIVHIINHQKDQETITSEAELEFGDEDEIKRYFEIQIRNVLKDSQTSAGRFLPSSDQSTTASLCYGILDSSNKASGFVAGSQEIAKRLFSVMAKNKRITPGCLVVCLYVDSNYSDTSFLALIKIDPSDVLVQTVSTDKGCRIVRFQARHNALPTTREKLHKAALVSPKGIALEYDLLLLDRQAPEIAADFFAKKFLNAEPTLDPETKTKYFYVGAQKAHKRLTAPKTKDQPHLDANEASVFQEQIETALKSRTIVIDPWIANMAVSDEAKSIIREEILKKLPTEQEINIDIEYAKEKLINKRTFRGDYGVLFEVEANHYDDVVRSREERTQADGKIVTTLVLDIVRLQWVTK